MRKYPAKKLISETQSLIRLSIFLQKEAGLKVNLSAKDLKRLLHAVKTKEKG